MEKNRLQELQFNREKAKLSNRKLCNVVCIYANGVYTGFQFEFDRVVFSSISTQMDFVRKNSFFASYKKNKFNLRYYMSNDEAIFYKMEV